MSKRLRLPAKIIAYVMESFDGLPHGHYMKRLPSVECVVGGNRYNAFPSPSENAITIVIAYSDAERNLFHDRAKTARELHSKAVGKQYAAQQRLTQAATDAGRLTGLRRERAEGARVQFEDQVRVAELEVERLKAIVADMDARITDWQPQESLTVYASEWLSNTYLLCLEDELAELQESILEQIKKVIRAGEPHTIAEIRMVMPPEELSLDQVERFLLEQDKTENKSRVSHIVQKIKEGRENATPRGNLPIVQQEGDVAGGDDQGQPGPDPVPALQGAVATTDQPGELPPNPVKSDRRKRS